MVLVSYCTLPSLRPQSYWICKNWRLSPSDSYVFVFLGRYATKAITEPNSKWDTIGNHKSFVTSVGKTPASIFTRVKDVMFTIYVSFVMKGYLQNFCYIKEIQYNN